MTSFLTYAFRVSSNSTPIRLRSKNEKISRRPCTGMRNLGGFQMSCAIRKPRSTVDSATTTISKTPSTRAISFWVLVKRVSMSVQSNDDGAVGADDICMACRKLQLGGRLLD